MLIVKMTMEELRGPVNTENGASGSASPDLLHKWYLGSLLNPLTPKI